MKLIVIISVLILIGELSKAINLKVMTFNTMCRSCDWKNKNGSYEFRAQAIADTIKRNSPDLIATQELESNTDVEMIENLLGYEYLTVYKKSSAFPTTDSVIFIKKGRFEVISENGIWLGPNAPYFSFGWKLSIPRRFQWVQLKDKISNHEFLFVGSHFDASGVNSQPSSEYAKTFFAEVKLPVIFAADTNLRPEKEGYANLITNKMQDSFKMSKTQKVIANAAYSKNELCPDNGGDEFPSCLIDHILVSKNSPWKVESWSVDLFRYYKGEKFVFDHRAVVIELNSK